MQKTIKVISASASVLCFMIFAAVIYANYAIPDEIFIRQTSDIKLDKPFTLSFIQKDSAAKAVSSSNSSDEYQLDVSLMDVIPVKSSKITVTKRRYVVPSGRLFGIRLYTDGVVVVGIDDVKTETATVNPAKNAGLQQGDIIKEVDNKKISSNLELSQAISKSKGNALEMLVQRNDEVLKIQFTPARSYTDGKYKAGIWIRDSSAGVGTITYLDRSNMLFAGLGHAVCDIDTGEIMPLLSGDIVAATVKGAYKGSSGNTGELCGVFENEVLGTLLKNGSTGVYGRLNYVEKNLKEIPVAMRYETKIGPAQIMATVDGNQSEFYDIKITHIYHNSETGEKNMTIEVTDEDLINKTGGIVQGMSGSPIIQDGMLVGAVTHVFVNNPLQGYAIFAENMINTGDSLNRVSDQKAS
ncbi:MAG: SpoIVB peptidase [Oscillospiraceae bacterium]|jgi:stage IV sporulation protein B|nr:SpoIVB peptidase [Oscillospiraceae bacterium]